MRILIQEVLEAKVTIDNEVVGQIEKGEVLFVGFTDQDDIDLARKMIDKLLKLRIFPDEEGKTNATLEQWKGSILCVSQFTLYADASKGNRPSFVKAMAPVESKPLYDEFCKILSERRPDTKYGVFGADMKVSLVNNGPFTILLDSKELF